MDEVNNMNHTYDITHTGYKMEIVEKMIRNMKGNHKIKPLKPLILLLSAVFTTAGSGT